MAIATANEVTLEFLEAFGAAWNRHAVDAIMASMADDCVFDITAGPEVFGKRYEGHERVRQAVARVFSIWPDAQFGHARHFACGNRGVSEWVFTGTRADGTRTEVNGCDLFTFRNGKIVHKDSYFKNRTA
jgi:steroid delta-isomerase-like uncharacterized protein